MSDFEDFLLTKILGVSKKKSPEKRKRGHMKVQEPKTRFPKIKGKVVGLFKRNDKLTDSLLKAINSFGGINVKDPRNMLDNKFLR